MMRPRRRVDQPMSPTHNTTIPTDTSHHRRHPSEPITGYNESVPTLQEIQAAHDAPASQDLLMSINHPVLQNLIPSLHRIVAVASYCTLYKLEISNGEWERPHIEG